MNDKMQKLRDEHQDRLREFAELEQRLNDLALDEYMRNAAQNRFDEDVADKVQNRKDV